MADLVVVAFCCGACTYICCRSRARARPRASRTPDPESWSEEEDDPPFSFEDHTGRIALEEVMIVAEHGAPGGDVSPRTAPYVEDVDRNARCGASTGYLRAEVFGVTTTIAHVAPEEDVDEEEVCAMCTEPIHPGVAVVRLPCSHVFHRCEQQQVSILDWLRCHPICPICETPVTLCVV